MGGKKKEKPKMKLFKDLQFNNHPNYEIGKQATMFFENGYGVSVVQFKLDNGRWGSYTDNENEYELAVLIGDESASNICYSTDITDDVIGHLSEDAVSEIMMRVQQLVKP